MNDLEMYREQLALCDDKIIDALVERGAIVEKIMSYKEEYGLPILQPQQEKKQKQRLEEKLTDNKYKEEIYDIFRCILENSKRVQARKLFDYNIVLIGFMGAGKATVSTAAFCHIWQVCAAWLSSTAYSARLGCAHTVPATSRR